MKSIKDTFAILVLAVLFTACSNHSPFNGTWYNNTNPCDSLQVTDDGGALMATYMGTSFAVELKEGSLKLLGEEIYTGTLDSKDELSINSMTYAKKGIDEKATLDGDWKIYECDEKINLSNISIKKDQMTIAYGSPIEIIGKTKRISKDSIVVMFESVSGSISMSKIIEEMNSKIDAEAPIAYLLPTTNNHATFTWKGITLKNEKAPWLSDLSDDIYWGRHATDANYVISIVKE